MALRGSSDLLAIADLIQITANGRKDCRILASTADGDAQLYFRDGRIVHAVYGDLVGPTAVYALVAAMEVEYQVEPNVQTSVTTIGAPVQELLFEAARLEDEGNLRRPTRSARLVRTEISPSGSGPLRGTADSMVSQVGLGRPRLLPAWIVLVLVCSVGVVVALFTIRSWDGVDVAEGVVATSAGVASGWAPNDRVFEVDELTSPADSPPKLVDAPRVQSPRATPVTPSVVVRTKVGAAGEVLDAKVYRSRLDLREFEDVAVQAIKQFRFEPARKAGLPVAAWVNVPIAFEHDDRGLVALRVKGSETIGGSLGPALAHAFAQRNTTVAVTVDAGGSATAFAELLAGTAEVGASSRPIERTELDEAARLDLTLREFTIGYDGIAVIVHPSNPVAELSLDQVAGLLTGKIANWSRVGGTNEKVVLLGRPLGSGTRTFVRDRVLAPFANELALDFAAGTQIVDSSDALARRVASEPGAIAYVGVAWVTPEVKALKLRTTDETQGVAPTPNAIRLGSYPIYRPLLFYTRYDMSRSAVAFVRFVLSDEGQAIVAEQGFVPVEITNESTIPSWNDVDEGFEETRVTRVFFADGEDKLDADARYRLGRLASAVRSGRQRLLIVDSADGARATAQGRGILVRRFLAEHGIARNRIRLESTATTEPAATSRTASDERQRDPVDVFVTE